MAERTDGDDEEIPAGRGGSQSGLRAAEAVRSWETRRSAVVWAVDFGVLVGTGRRVASPPPLPPGTQNHRPTPARSLDPRWLSGKVTQINGLLRPNWPSTIEPLQN